MQKVETEGRTCESVDPALILGYQRQLLELAGEEHFRPGFFSENS